MAATSGSADGRNFWAIWLWVVEVAYAVISGIYEAWMYSAYAPSGEWWAPYEAGTRAMITQVFVVLLGRAAVGIYEKVNKQRGGFPSFLATLPLHAIALAVFAAPAMWLMHETALQFRQDAALSRVGSQQYTAPNGLVFQGQDLDAWIIADLPVLLVVVNLFAPIITAKKELDDPAMVLRRQELERMRAEHNAKMLALRAGGLRVGLSALRKPAEADLMPAQDDASGASFDGGISGDMAGGNGGDYPKQDGHRAKVTRLNQVKAGRWHKLTIMQYVKLAYPALDFAEQDALDVLRYLNQIGKAERAAGARGNGYVAASQSVKAELKRRYGAPGRKVTAADMRALDAEAAAEEREEVEASATA